MSYFFNVKTESFNRHNFKNFLIYYFQIKGNRICRQVEWYENEEQVTAWRNGQTGFPWIDAVMRQMVT